MSEVSSEDEPSMPFPAESDHPDIQKCEFYAGSEDEDGNVTWAVDVPDDASVQVQLVVKAGREEEIVGGTGNIAGRYELTSIRGGDGDE